MDKYGDYKRFTSPEDVKTWVSSHYTQKQLDEFDMNLHMDGPISDYKGSGYRAMNEIIRAGAKYGITELNSAGYDILGLQGQLMKMKTPENIIATRFINMKELLIIRKATCFGKAMIYNGFLSTTLLKEYYSMDDKKHGRIPISLFIPVGTPGMYLPEVNPNCPEYEFLLPYGVKLKHIGNMKYIIQ